MNFLMKLFGLVLLVATIGLTSCQSYLAAAPAPSADAPTTAPEND